MCQFCIEHGEGERWYLQAKVYAADLASDLERRGYVVDFIKDFEANRAKIISGLAIADRLPEKTQAVVKRRVQEGFLRNHFGQPVPLEECESIFDITSSITRIPCVCRRAARTSDDRHCMVVTTRPIDDVLLEGFADYEDGPDLSDFHRISKAEAVEWLVACEEQGLMHSVWTFKTPFIAAICNCDLESGCMAMRISVTHDTPIMWRGEHVAEVDAGVCSGCGECAALCPFGAIADGSRGTPASIRISECWGCGICRSACAPGAITLRDRREIPQVAAVW